jgi:GntR family transcriptional regulator, arabinose operon transcriptional repressor
MPATLKRPKSQVIRKYVLDRLASGQLKHGDSLPTEPELARKLGVGRYSVRQALAELSEAGVVQRVKKRGTVVTIENPSVQSMVNRSGYGLIIPEILSGIYPSLIKGFSEGAAAARQELMTFESATDVYRQGDTILRMLQKNVAGVAIVPVFDPMPEYQLLALQSNGVPVVFCHRRTTSLPAPLVGWSYEEIGRLAASTLAELGHHHLAFVDSVRTGSTERCLAGFRSELQRRGITLPDASVFIGTHFLWDADSHLTEELVARPLKRSRRPTAVFCGDDYLSERLFLTAMRLGLRVPEDLSIIGFGPTFRDGPVRAGLAAIVVDEVDLGHQAAGILNEISIGRRAANDDEEILLPLRLMRGQSLGAAAES